MTGTALHVAPTLELAEEFGYPTDCVCRGARGGALTVVRALLAEVAILRDAIVEQSQGRTVRFKVPTMRRGAEEKARRVRELLATMPACTCQPTEGN